MNKTAQGGFNIIELMIVVGIIGVLAVFVIPGYQRFKDRAYNAELTTYVKFFSTTIEAFLAENSSLQTVQPNWTHIVNDLGFQHGSSPDSKPGDLNIFYRYNTDDQYCITAGMIDRGTVLVSANSEGKIWSVEKPKWISDWTICSPGGTLTQKENLWAVH